MTNRLESDAPSPTDGFLVDDAKIARARKLADRIAGDIQSFIDAHTTVSIERTVLRLLGIDGTGPRGVPLANLMVERLQKAGLLDRGAAYWYGRALRMGASGPMDLLERLPKDASTVSPLTPEERETMKTEVRGEALAAVDVLRARNRARKALIDEVGTGERPHKYVIVATGNIYEDARQGVAAAEAGADVIAVIRSTAQSLLDYVPPGATTEGFGGTFATQENFRIMRQALDEASRRLGRYIHLVNYASGLCMPEIAYMAAAERLDMLLNDSMYGILFRDINMRRTFVDQYFSRRICALSEITINTGEDNYLTTAEAYEGAHTVVASQFINEAFGHRAGLRDELMGLGHAFEISPKREDQLLWELSSALLVRRLFPRHPIKYMPPTKHMTGDIFFGHVLDNLFNLVGVWTKQGIQLLGMPTEAVHNPFLQDRYMALKSADYIWSAARHLSEEITVRPDGRIARRAAEILDETIDLLEKVADETLWTAIESARFADIKRTPTGGKGLEGVVRKSEDYFNPFLEILEEEA